MGQIAPRAPVMRLVKDGLPHGPQGPATRPATAPVASPRQDGLYLGSLPIRQIGRVPSLFHARYYAAGLTLYTVS
jgi:hypothetical protein